MDLAAVNPFPDLPTDVARFLFETAAWEDPRTAERLTRVSKLVRQWIDPILYHTVTLHTISQLVWFTVSISARNDPAFFARNVKILRLGDFIRGGFPESPGSTTSWSADDKLVQTVLKECTGVRRLAFWLDREELLLYAFTYIRPSHLSMVDMPAYCFTLDEYVKFVPASLTHLHLDHGSSNEDNVQSIPWQVFVACPGLSHICLSGLIAGCFLTDTDFISLVVDPLTALPSNISIFVIYVDYRTSLDTQTQSDIDNVVCALETLAAASNRFVAISDYSDYNGEITNLHCFWEYRDIETHWGDGRATDIWEFANICLAQQNQRRQDQVFLEVEVGE